MGLEFRCRDYRAEENAYSFERTGADTHPLSAPSPSQSPSLQVEAPTGGNDDFFDPLKAEERMEVSREDTQHDGIRSEMKLSKEMCDQLRVKEWNYFKKNLMQKFPVSKSTAISMVSVASVKGSKDHAKPSRDSSDQQKVAEGDTKGISQQEYVVQLQELAQEIRQSWCAGNHVASLRLSIKVARLLMKTSTIQFYPTLFVLVTDIMDMVGDLVWNRIKQKAESSDDGGLVHSLPENFEVADICFDASETCNNWFSKIGAVEELLPRIYLELAILPCWRFLLDHPDKILQRIALMVRGIADPVASAYCCSYMVQCAQRLPKHDKGFMVTYINDLQVVLMRIISKKESTHGNLSVDSKLILTVIEPAIEHIIRFLFKDIKQLEMGNMLLAVGMGKHSLMLFEDCSSISIILQHILKELPIGCICSNALQILHLIDHTKDCSFDQSLNFRLLGLRLCEKVPEVNRAHSVVEAIFKVLSCIDNLIMYLMISDAYLDIILENQLGSFLNVLLDGIFERLQKRKIDDTELMMLQSIFLKFITHFDDIENILALNHFLDILYLTHGSSRNCISEHILSIAARNPIQDPIVIQVLFEVAQALYDGADFSTTRSVASQSRIITRFVSMVDHRKDVERHLRFLAQCRGAFASISELQELLVHSSNSAAVGVMKDGNITICSVKSWLTFNEVTIPSIPSKSRQFNLYLETAEVALLGDFLSHSDGLIDAAVNCLLDADLFDGLQIPTDVEWIISLICKLCDMLLIVPGSPEREMTFVSRQILSFLDSNSCILSSMKIKVSSAIVLLFAALVQDQLLYHTSQKVICNQHLHFGVPSYHEELLSLSGVVLQDLVNIVIQEPSMVVRGRISLELCNCVASAFKICDETQEACSKLLEIAKSCLSPDDNFLMSTLMYLNAHKFCL